MTAPLIVHQLAELREDRQEVVLILHDFTFRAHGSVDVLLSVSALEHFAVEDLDELSIHTRRILQSRGVVILTVDLFLDLHPFCDARSNVYGRNVDLRDLLGRVSLDLRTGNREELFGFPEFDPRRILSRLSKYHLGTGYPALAQCPVATVRS